MAVDHYLPHLCVMTVRANLLPLQREQLDSKSAHTTMSLGGRIFENAAAECPSIRETWCSSFYIFCPTYRMPPATPVKPCSHDIEGLLQQDSWGPGLLFGLGGVEFSFLRVLHWPLFHCPAHRPFRKMATGRAHGATFRSCGADSERSHLICILRAADGSNF